ncbi:hypothetical protein VitviT2T_002966 [Vitis vinifera]|uniref:Subtilisin-like protease SBT3.6 n=1 Tax=Vitis vinifera TaxID=29760 RepID=A0ABY9BKS0_VITVI|nr:subtilisin-like protease SBT3.6 isoform X2 [Vitis vinifera]WJZ83269.1 hypothetical protein VitviT2T_002966 [Vitis vinifera]|eukprot:XP_010647672.1 PREDICTED: subtilisin-like protease SBT3.6 isoform X2 [Vitis vinifera]
MAFPCVSFILLLLLLLLLLQESCFVLSRLSTNVYIVYMGERPHDEPELIEDSHHQILSNLLGSEEAAKESILYHYKHGFSGFAAVLTESQAKVIADFPGVVRVVPNRILSLQTTRSWDFLHVNPHSGTGILSKSLSGFGSIIGIIDTGIWPESDSFKDKGMGKIPSRWHGTCQEGEQFNRSNCNRKIIGARWYIKGYEADFGKLDTSGGVEFLSPRDAVGHGTHTASIAAGSLVKNANFRGLARGLARGGAPSAQLAVYKVCWSTGGCSSADVLAAFDDAVLDGVDVLSVSLGSSPPLTAYFDDSLAIGSFHAVAKGISVVCSAGNSGPYPQTVINTAPWIISVAASTIDRAFRTVITLGNNQTLVGQALYTGKNVNKFYSFVYGESIVSQDSDEESARGCDIGSLNATLARGNVVLCFQTRSQRFSATAIRTVQTVGGVGLIFAKSPSKDVTQSMGIPCVEVDLVTGTSLLTYMVSTSKPMVKFSPTKTKVGLQSSPEVAYFSSRGPSSLSPSVLKPDIAAPGVSILAAWSPAASSPTIDMTQKELPPENFMIESGTSMACPHVSGIVALLNSMYPTWSPAAIKSALITTASVKDEYGLNVVAEGAPYKQADPFDYGGGHVDPNKAMDPGLIYDMGMKDYVHFLCSMGYNTTAIHLITKSPCPKNRNRNLLLNLNLPSIIIPNLKKSLAVSRTVTNVGPEESVYIAQVEAPPGTNVRVEPWILSFNSTTKKLKFKVFFCSRQRLLGRYSFGHLLWGDGFHAVRIPLIIGTVTADL